MCPYVEKTFEVLAGAEAKQDALLDELFVLLCEIAKNIGGTIVIEKMDRLHKELERYAYPDKGGGLCYRRKEVPYE